jgi:hypothetical protein
MWAARTSALLKHVDRDDDPFISRVLYALLLPGLFKLNNEEPMITSVISRTISWFATG